MSNQRDKVLKGFAWVLSERLATQGITFILQIVLARILMPEQFGIIAMINVFIALANVFVITGFSAALIQKKDANELDFSTIFYCSLVVAVLLYGILYATAPAIERYYNNMPGLCDITRVYALSLILSTYNSTQRAFVTRHMQFQKIFYSTAIGAAVSGTLGIAMAYMGYGVWALVAQYLSNIVVGSIVLQFIASWHPRLMFSLQRAKSLMSFGANILGAALMGAIFEELRQLLIGKYYTATDLSFYNRGRSFPHLVQTNVTGVINTVLFPAMSNHSDDPSAIKHMTRVSMKVASYLMCYTMTMMAVAAQPLIILILTEKWAPAIPFMQVICLAEMINVVSQANMQALKASGRGDVLFKLEFIKKPAFLIFVIIAVKISVMAIAITMPLYSIYAAITNMSPNKKVLGYSMREQLRDLMPSSLLALALAAVTVPFLFIDMGVTPKLICQIVLGTLTYWGLSCMFKVDSYQYVVNIVKDKILKRKEKQ